MAWCPARHPGEEPAPDWIWGRDPANTFLDSGPDAIGDDRGKGMPYNLADAKLFTRQYTKEETPGLGW